MASNQKRREASSKSGLEASAPESCNCQPLSIEHRAHTTGPNEGAGHAEKVGDMLEVSSAADDEQFVPASALLRDKLHHLLDTFFPRTAPISVLLLHVSQLEPVPFSHAPGRRRRRYHPPAGLLEQILANVRRVIRTDDDLLVQQDSGAAIVLPNVDRQGAYTILERVYHSVSLLQAETVVPPLTRETTIVIGSGSYPAPGASMERMLYHTGQIARSLTLRPALMTRRHQPQELLQQENREKAHSTRRAEASAPLMPTQPARSDQTLPPSADEVTHGKGQSAIPYMDLPRELPTRLKQLIPYHIAQAIRCVPVGRDHRNLTVAMMNPLNSDDVRHLQELTGMTIFPVSCEEEDLNILLAKKW